MEQTINRVSDVLKQVYKDMKMGADSLLDIMGKVKNEALRVDLTAHMEGYLRFAEQAKSYLDADREEAKEENFFTRVSAKMGMAMNTVMDSTSSHLAEMVIEGSTMGITDMTRVLHRLEDGSAEGDTETAKTLVKEIIAFEEKNVERMKAYL